MSTESLPSRAELNRMHEAGEVSDAEFARLRKAIAERVQRGEPLQVETIEGVGLPSKAELNRRLKDGEIDKKTYNHMRLVLIADVKRKKSIRPFDEGASKSADAILGRRWRFASTGGVSFVVYIAVIAIMLVSFGAHSTGIVPESGTSINETGDSKLNTLLLYGIPALPSLIIGLMGIVNQRGRAWARVTVTLSLIANPSFVVLGIIANPTWALFTQL